MEPARLEGPGRDPGAHVTVHSLLSTPGSSQEAAGPALSSARVVSLADVKRCETPGSSPQSGSLTKPVGPGVRGADGDQHHSDSPDTWLLWKVITKPQHLLRETVTHPNNRTV